MSTPGKFITLSLRHRPATHVEQAWLDEAEQILEAECCKRWANLMAYGTTHPDVFYFPPSMAGDAAVAAMVARGEAVILKKLVSSPALPHK